MENKVRKTFKKRFTETGGYIKKKGSDGFWTHLENGQHQNSSSGNSVGTERLQEKNQDDRGRTG